MAISCYDLLVKDDIVFDIGANFGHQTSLFLERECFVVAVEPDRFAVDCLGQLFQRAIEEGRLVVVQAAIGPEAGEVDFYQCISYSPKSTCNPKWKDFWDDAYAPPTKVPMLTIDSLIEKYGMPKYIKIDIEGHDIPAITNGLTKKIPLLSFEWRQEEEQGVYDHGVDGLRDLGYTEFNYVMWIEAYKFAVIGELYLKEWQPLSDLKGYMLDFRRDEIEEVDIYVR